MQADRKARAAAWFVVFLHQAAAAINAFWFHLPGSGADTRVFHNLAAKIAVEGLSRNDLVLGTPLFRTALGTCYSIFGHDSYYLGMQLAVFSISVSCLLLTEIVYFLGVSRYAPLILLVWGCIPSHIVYTGTLLREGWQGAFLVTAIYWGLRLISNPNDKAAMIAFPLSCGALGAFHKGLAFYALLLFGTTAWLASQNIRITARSGTHPVTTMVQLAVLLVVLAVFTGRVDLGQSDSQVVTSVQQGKILEFAEEYRARAKDEARANYGVQLDTTTFIGLLTTVPAIFLLYMFAPLPWQIGAGIDVIASVEGLLRMVLLLASYKAFQQATGTRRTQLAYVLGAFFVLEFIWAMGTMNWGPACRHRTVGWFLLVLVGVPALKERGRFPAVPEELREREPSPPQKKSRRLGPPLRPPERLER